MQTGFPNLDSTLSGAVLLASHTPMYDEYPAFTFSYFLNKKIVI